MKMMKHDQPPLKALYFTQEAMKDLRLSCNRQYIELRMCNKFQSMIFHGATVHL